MNENKWLEEYILLVLRMDRAMQVVDSSYFLDTYYGPPELRTRAKEEPVLSFPQLSGHAQDLLASLPGLGFENSRAGYLAKHISAIEALAEIQAGVEMPFYFELERVFDIDPVWISEDEFIASLKRLDQAIPGTGDLRTRFQSLLEVQQIDEKSGRSILLNASAAR